MELKNVQKSYQTIVSLGSYPSIAYELDRYRLRKFTGPLDGLKLESIYNLNKILKNGFSDLMKINNLKIEGKKKGHYLVKDIVYNCFSKYDFPINDYDKDWYSMYNQFNKKFKSRIENFFYQIENSESILFIRLGVEYKGLKQLQKILKKYVRGDFNILALNYLKDDFVLSHNKNIIEKELKIPNVCYAEIPNTKGNKEKNNKIWDYLLQGVSVE